MSAALPRGRSFPLRAHLLVLVVGTLLPALVLSAVLLRRVVEDNRDSIRRRLIETARTEAALVDSELSSTIRALQALAESDRLTAGNLVAFREEAERLRTRQAAWHSVVLQAPDGQGVLDTIRPFGAAVPAVADEHLVRQVLSGEPRIGTLRMGGQAGEAPAFPVHVPVARNGRVEYVLSALITPERLMELLRRQRFLSDEWARGVVDSAGLVVARTRDPERFIGQPGTPGLLERIATQSESVYRDTSLEGVPVYGAFARAPMSGWIAGVAVPAAVVDAGFRQSMIVLAGIGAALFGLGFFGSYVISSRIARDIGRAASAADAIALGQPTKPAHSTVREANQLSDSLSRASALLDVRQRERDEQLAHADAARAEAEAARVEAEAARVEAEAARAEAEAADHAKDAFLAMLGHELRNPLAPVLTALELMRLRGDSASQREREIIDRQVRHLVRLVDDLFDVSRLRRGRVELRRRRFEIIRAIEKAVEIAGPLIAERGQRLTIDVPIHGLSVDGDETRLSQVFVNLLTNAAKYSERNGCITVRGCIVGESVVVSCEDDGVGIAPELLPHVFDLFAQGRQALDRRDGGLGLGLTVAKTLVELHGGTLEALSHGVGKGSTFTMSLPLVTPDADALPEIALRSPLHGRGARVLVVDDNRDSAEMLASMLRLAGFIVEKEYDGVAALATMARFQAEVALLDIGLPSMDGFELARRLRAIDPGRPLRLIAVTGYGQAADFAASRAAGFDLHLVKPVSLDTLFEAMREGASA